MNYDFWRTERKKDLKLGRLAAAKSLDIPLDDDMNIISNKSGISTAAFLGAMGLTGGLAVLVPLLLPLLQQKPSTPISPVVQQKPIDSSYNVRFFNSDGDLINIPQKKE